MKNIVFPVLGLLVLFCCRADKPVSEIQEKSDDIISSRPIEQEWILDEDFVIPGKREGEYTLGGLITDLKIDSKGNILVLDKLEGCVRVFDDGGRYLRSIGKQGRGSGELTEAVAFALDPDGNIHIVQVMKHDRRNRRMNVFAHQGDLLRTMVLTEYVAQFFFTAGGGVLAKTIGHKGQEIAIYDKNMNKQRTLALLPPPKQIPSQKKRSVADFANHPDLLLGALNNRGFIYCESSDNKLSILDPYGEPLFVIEKSVEATDTSTRFILVDGDGEGNILAVSVHSGDSFFKTRKMFIEVFDDHGRFIHKTTTDAFGILKITEDAVFGLRFHEALPPDIVKFRQRIS